MLIEKNYKRNKNGEIVKREIVEVRCDNCGKEWGSVYASRKIRTLSRDLCRSCRAKFRILTKGWKPWIHNNPKVEVTCINCGCKKLKVKSFVNKINNFCSISCRDQYWLEKKYYHLYTTFDNNPDEVAYLIGLVMGDGNIRKSGRQTVRIGIAFDLSGRWDMLFDSAKKVLSKLQINWFEQPKKFHGCKMLGFVLPKDLLEKYGHLHCGHKFKVQPFPSSEICKNINYAAGLLNSDGFVRNDSYYVFSNTVKSIVDSFSLCLSTNDIKHTVKKKNGRYDNRTGNTGKDFYVVYITGGKMIATKLKKMCKFELKE